MRNEFLCRRSPHVWASVAGESNVQYDVNDDFDTTLPYKTLFKSGSVTNKESGSEWNLQSPLYKSQ
jgi:hypothetical protein